MDLNTLRIHTIMENPKLDKNDGLYVRPWDPHENFPKKIVRSKKMEG